MVVTDQLIYVLVLCHNYILNEKHLYCICVPYSHALCIRYLW